MSFLAGVAFSILLIPINKYIAGKIGELSTKMMERKDVRVKMMTEVLRGIKSVKLHVWEQHFVKLITSPYFLFNCSPLNCYVEYFRAEGWRTEIFKGS